MPAESGPLLKLKMDQEKTHRQDASLNPETWLDRYGDYLYRFAVSRVRDPSAAEDLVQETFLAALGSMNKYESRSSPKTWLTGILKHKIIDYFRRKAREPIGDDLETAMQTLEGLFDARDHWQNGPVEWSGSPQDLYEKQEFLKVLDDCISELSSRLASVFILREIVGETTEEICKALDISATNCWVMLYRARMHLRRCIEAGWFQPDTS